MKAFIISVLFLSSPIGIAIVNIKDAQSRSDVAGGNEANNFNSDAESDFANDNAIIFCMLLNPN